MELINREKPLHYIWEKIRSVYQNNQMQKADMLKKKEFLGTLAQAKNDLEIARSNYNFAQEPALLEYYIYEIKAAETRLNYYLKMAKKEQVSNNWYPARLLIPAGGRSEKLS